MIKKTGNLWLQKKRRGLTQDLTSVTIVSTVQEGGEIISSFVTSVGEEIVAVKAVGRHSERPEKAESQPLRNRRQHHHQQSEQNQLVHFGLHSEQKTAC